MHSLSKEMLSVKVIHLGNKGIMQKKANKLMKQSKAVLRVIAVQVRSELGLPQITDVILFDSTTKMELVQDILFSLRNSVTNNLNTILQNGK